MCFDICTINIRVSIRVRGLHFFFWVVHCPQISLQEEKPTPQPVASGQLLQFLIQPPQFTKSLPNDPTAGFATPCNTILSRCHCDDCDCSHDGERVLQDRDV